MNLPPGLLVSVLAFGPVPGPVAAQRVATASPSPPDSPEALRDLCHGKDSCSLAVVPPPRDSAFLVRATSPDANHFIHPEDGDCDRREYWHVAGPVHTLLAVDCAEQWGPDSQGPVHVSIEGSKIKLTYVEWEYDRECEKAVAVLDFRTAKLVSFKRWAGVASDEQTDCRRLKPLKAPPPGDGKAVPLVPFHSDSVSDVGSGRTPGN